MSEDATNLGQPKVLAAMRDAQSNVKAVHKAKKKQEDKFAFQDADAVITASKEALRSAGLTWTLDLSTPRIEGTSLTTKSGALTIYAVDAELRVIHPDDQSSLTYTSTGSTLVNAMGKFGAAANTFARKAVFMSALGITTGASDEVYAQPFEPDEDFLIIEHTIESCATAEALIAFVKTDEYQSIRDRGGKDAEMLKRIGRGHLEMLRRRLPENVEYAISQVMACTTPEEVRDVTGTDEYQALRGDHRQAVDAAWEKRRKDLYLLGFGGRK